MPVCLQHPACSMCLSIQCCSVVLLRTHGALLVHRLLAVESCGARPAGDLVLSWLVLLDICCALHLGRQISFTACMS